MFKNLRNAIAAMIAAPVAVVKPNLTAAKYAPEVNIPTQKRSVKADSGVEGVIDLECIRNLSSDVLRKSLMGKLVYGSIAKAFNIYSKAQGRSNDALLRDQVEQGMAAAAEAVAASDSMGYIVDMSPEKFQFLATTGVPAKLTEVAGKQICDITGGSVTELIAKREATRKARYLSNVATLEVFLNTVEGWVVQPRFDAMGELIEPKEINCSLSGTSAISGLTSCMEFVSTWTDDVRVAAEMLLMKHDHQMIEQALARNVKRTRAAAPDYVSALDDALLDANGMTAGANAGK